MTRPPESRRAGILVPLFSIPSTTSWGIGEIGDIELMTRWLDRAGQCILQVVSIHEMPPGGRSPYWSLAALPFYPQFIPRGAWHHSAAIGGEAALESESRATIDSARTAPAIDYT